MPGIRFNRLVDSFIDTLERSGASVIRTPSVNNRRPAACRVMTVSQSNECLLFLWAVTPGGGGADVRPATERRIQMTNVGGMPLRPGINTILGGWSEEFHVYAFWDARRHTSFSLRSPSLQVNANTLETAASVGIASQLRPTAEGQEVVIAVHPSSLLWYVENGRSLHDAGEDSPEISSLAEASPDDEQSFLDGSGSEEGSIRRDRLVATMRSYRDAKFRPVVLQAFGFKCAVCSVDLKLVDAAHIVPVSHPTSTDDVTNGLALCRLHHGAYDNALLGVQSDYSIVINPDVASRLRHIGLATSLSQFQSALPDTIRIPASIEARPSPEYLKLGLELRRWPPNFIA